MKKNKIEIECDHCHELFDRCPSLIGKLNFCCKSHYHLYHKGDCKKEVICLYCGKIFKEYKTYSNRRQFCCQEHRDKWTLENTKDFKCLYCEEIFHRALLRNQNLKFCCNDHRELWKNDNGLKKIKIQCRNCDKVLSISEKYVCADNFCDKECQRSYMEKMGIWIPSEDKTDWEIYNDKSNWIQSMYEFLSINEKTLLSEQGMFNSINNKNGLVRDHIVSRRIGYKYKIFVELIRHPVNCRLITSCENISRHFYPTLPEYDRSYHNLFDKIHKWNGSWIEHDKCIELIDKYNRGERWERRL